MTEVLLVHGAWHGAWCWHENWTPHFEMNGFPVTAVELHQAQKPGDHRRVWTRMSTYVSIVREALASMGPSTVLVGHSMGGLVVQRALEGTSAKGMVLLAAVPARGAAIPTLRTIRRTPVPTVRTILGMNMWPIIGSPELTRAAFFTPDTDESVVQSTYQRLQNESYLAYLSMITRVSRPRAVSAPALVIAAEQDPLFSVSEQQSTARKYGTEAVIIPGSGHDIMLDRHWEQAADSVIDWINQQDRESS